MSEEFLKRKGEILRAARIAKDSSTLAIELFDFKVKWYHSLYDKEIKDFERRLKEDFDTYTSTFSYFSAQVQEQDQEFSTVDQTVLSMLTVSGHLYAESMRVIKVTRYRALVLGGIVINVAALLFFWGFIN